MSTRIHWGRILLGGLLAELALILAIVPLGLRLGETFLHCTAPPGVVHHMLPGRDLGRSADRIPFRPARDSGGDGRGVYLYCVDTRPA